MAERIIHTYTTSDNQLLRIRERGILERLGSHSFVVELLVNGSFKVLVDGKYNSEEDAREGINKIYRLDNIAQIRKEALQRLTPGFQETLKGTKDYDLYELLDNLVIVEFRFFDDRWPRAICKTDGDYSVRVLNKFLSKYGYTGGVKAIEIEIMNDDYVFNLITYNKEHCLYHSLYEEDRENAYELKVLFESKLNPRMPLRTV